MSGWSSLRSEEARENNRRLSREAKRRRRGRCVECGAETRYGGRASPVSERCQTCGAKYVGQKLRGRGHVAQALYAYLASGPKRYTQNCNELGVSRGQVNMTLSRAMRYGDVVRIQHGVYALGSFQESKP